jgi:hypothetical protein
MSKYFTIALLAIGIASCNHNNSEKARQVILPQILMEKSPWIFGI